METYNVNIQLVISPYIYVRQEIWTQIISST